MLTSLAFLVAGSTLALTPTDDIWIYPHASDQTDPYLRFWGSEGASLPDPNFDFSGAWSCLKFDLSKAPSKELKSAKLTIWLIPGSTITQDVADKYPIEVRMGSTQFTEKTFDLGQTAKVTPPASELAIFGLSKVKLYDNNDKATKIEIDLMAGKSTFAKYFKDSTAVKDKQLGLALTSAIDPAEVGQSGIYKIYSRNADNEFKPKLDLTFAD
ncbi:MAG: hypothetical protein KF836_05725 [Fimbriimonadaceae bacterium]|nr:hypothetical protein [Fimbriimonadaceae bacterium]